MMLEGKFKGHLGYDKNQKSDSSYTRNGDSVSKFCSFLGELSSELFCFNKSEIPNSPGKSEFLYNNPRQKTGSNIICTFPIIRTKNRNYQFNQETNLLETLP